MKFFSLKNNRVRMYQGAALAVCICFCLSGCFRERTKYKGEGIALKIPASWKIARKEDRIEKLFKNVSEYGSDLVTFDSLEKNPRTGLPKARISIFSQKFTQPLWVEDITGDILDWISRQGYRIIGSGKINYQGSTGFSVNYVDDRTGLVYLEFYFASDSRVYVVILLETTEEDFKFYVPDYENFRNSIEFPFLTF